MSSTESTTETAKKHYQPILIVSIIVVVLGWLIWPLFCLSLYPGLFFLFSKVEPDVWVQEYHNHGEGQRKLNILLGVLLYILGIIVCIIVGMLVFVTLGLSLIFFPVGFCMCVHGGRLLGYSTAAPKGSTSHV